MRTIKDILKDMPTDIPVTIVTNKHPIATMLASSWLNVKQGYSNRISDVMFNDITETYCKAKDAPKNITIFGAKGYIKISSDDANAYIVKNFKNDITKVVDGLLEMPAKRIYMLLINEKNIDTGGEGMIIDTSVLPIFSTYNIDDLPETASSRGFDRIAEQFVGRNPNMFTGYFDALNKEASK